MKRVSLVLCALAVVSAAMGKRASRQAKPAPLTLHVTTHLVQVNVIVLDHHGHPVSDLTRKDFKLFDNGKPQAITGFHVELNQAPAHSAPPLPPNSFSNQSERAGYSMPSVTVILLDALNTHFADLSFARQAVMKFLEQLPPNRRIAIYVLGRKLEVLHDFTSDVSPLVKSVRQYRGGPVRGVQAPETELPGTESSQDTGSDTEPGSSTPASIEYTIGSTEEAQIERWLTDAQEMQNNFYARQRVTITTNALIAIANHLAGLPGRKNLIWVSGGIPMWRNLDRLLRPVGGMQNFQSPILDAARALNNANMAVYPVDARGEMVDRNFNSRYVQFSRRRSRRITANFTGNFDTMDTLATLTGGRAFYNTNDIHGSIQSVVNDSSVNYLLAYYPKDVDWNGEYRKIKVRVDRRGVQLRYRRGYTALFGEPRSGTIDTATLAAALASPLDATAMGLTVQVTEEDNGKNPGLRTFFARFMVDPRDISFSQEGNRWVASLTLVTEEMGSKGENLKGAYKKIQLHLDPVTYQRLLSNGLAFHEQLPFPFLPNAESLRVIIRDDPTGRTGSVNVPLWRVTPPRSGINH